MHISRKCITVFEILLRLICGKELGELINFLYGWTGTWHGKWESTGMEFSITELGSCATVKFKGTRRNDVTIKYNQGRFRIAIALSIMVLQGLVISLLYCTLRKSTFRFLRIRTRWFERYDSKLVIFVKFYHQKD